MTRPNIFLIMSDQQRFDTVGAWGYDYMHTPAQDRLVEQGVSFRSAYCPGATCIATRAAMFTGMYAHNTGVYSFHNWAHQRTWVHDLRDAGYLCANIGKMHISPRDDMSAFHDRVIVENPTNLTHWRGGVDDDWGKFLAHHGHERPNHRQNTDPQWHRKFQGAPWHLEERFHSDVFIGDAALSWINNWRGDEPIFLQIGFTGPHDPYDPLPRHLALYDEVDVPAPTVREGEHDDNPPQHRAQLEAFANNTKESRIDLRTASPEDIARMRKHYYANITTVDEKIGQVIDALKARGWLENSLLIFCSDHGDMVGDHGLMYKWLMFDEIVHVPLMMVYTGADRVPRQVDDLVSLIDVGPTILDVAGIEIPRHLEGRSLMPYLTGAETEPRQYVFSEDNYLTMIRSETHKLVYYTSQPYGELYDLRADPDELHNKWDDPAFATIKAELISDLLAWITSSSYHTAGYKQKAGLQYDMRRATDESNWLINEYPPSPPQTMG